MKHLWFERPRNGKEKENYSWPSNRYISFARHRRCYTVVTGEPAVAKRPNNRVTFQIVIIRPSHEIFSSKRKMSTASQEKISWRRVNGKPWLHILGITCWFHRLMPCDAKKKSYRLEQASVPWAVKTGIQELINRPMEQESKRYKLWLLVGYENSSSFSLLSWRILVS